MESIGPTITRRLTDQWVFREYIRLAVSVLATMSTAGLALLVLSHEPLPFGDLRSSALATSIFCLLVTGLVLYVHHIPVLSFPSLFLVATFLFTCSPLILYQFQGSTAFRDWEWIDVDSTLVAMPLIALAFSSFLLGSMIMRTAIPKTDDPTTNERVGPDPDLRLFRRIGFALYVASVLLIAAFSLTGGALTFAFEGGYHAFHGAKRAGEISQLAGVSLSRMLPWSLLILTATTDDRRSRIVVVLMSIPALAIMLAIGDRSGPIAAMVIIASGMLLRGSRISWGRSLAVATLVAFLFPAILNLREIPISQWSGDALEMAATNQVEDTNTFEEDFLGGFLITTSGSYQTLMATVKVVPQEEEYHYGSDYMSSLVVALPFRSMILPWLNVEINRIPPSQWVLSYLHPGRTAGPGYLQLAEAYLQFGAVGIVGLFVILGWGLTRLWQFVASKPLDVRAVAFSLIVMSETLIWVRNSSELAVRALVWGWLLIYLLPALFRGRRVPSNGQAERSVMLPLGLQA